MLSNGLYLYYYMLITHVDYTTKKYKVPTRILTTINKTKRILEPDFQTKKYNVSKKTLKYLASKISCSAQSC